MPKPEDVEVRFIEAVRECHKWGVAERILSYYESLYNKDPIHIYNELDLIKSGYYPRDIVKPEYINKYTLSIASIRDVLNTISGHGESNDFQKLIEFWGATL